jgi:hypothetical protein
MALQFLLLVKLALLLVLLAILGLAVWRMRHAKGAQDRLVAGLDPASARHWFRVAVTRPDKLRSLWKLWAFEARGVLVNGSDGVRVLAELPSGERLDRTWRRDELALRWVGNAGLGSANLHWLSIGAGERALLVTADTGMNAMQSREATADICRMLDPRLVLPESARRDFALEKDPSTLLPLCLFFAAIAYALVDGVVLDKHQVLDAGWTPWGLPVVLLVVLPVLAWQLARKVPTREAATLTILLAGALVAAYFPALKRLDQALAGGARMHAYRLEGNGMLAATPPGPPAIDYSRHAQYWDQFAIGSVHEFPLVHGPLGMWQVDRAGIEAKMRAFYQARPRRRR